MASGKKHVLQVESSSLVLSESDGSKRRPFLRVESRQCSTVARLQPARVAATVDIAHMTALDLCSHSHGISQLLLQRCGPPSALSVHQHLPSHFLTLRTLWVAPCSCVLSSASYDK